MWMGIQTVAPDADIRIPASVAVCPICGSEVVVEIEAWEQNDDGSWQAGESGTYCNCITEPDMDGDEWEDWFRGHWSMPYVDWLPVDEKVKAWLDRHYRFAVPA